MLKKCRHRLEQVADDYYGCSCPGLVGGHNVVTGKFCNEKCPYVDRPLESFCGRGLQCPPTRWQRLKTWLRSWWSGKSSYPSATKQAANLAVATVAIVTSGFREASEDVRLRRKTICQSCPSGMYVQQDERCRACGCNVNASKIMDKLRWAAMECPKGHWGAEK